MFRRERNKITYSNAPFSTVSNAGAAACCWFNCCRYTDNIQHTKSTIIETFARNIRNSAQKFQTEIQLDVYAFQFQLDLTRLVRNCIISYSLYGFVEANQQQTIYTIYVQY